MDKERRIFADGAVAFEGSTITELGSTEKLKTKYPEADIIDASNKVIMPGLIDCHIHYFQTLMKGLGDDLPLVEWLQKCIWPLSRNLGREESKAGALLGSLEMLKTGTTCCVDSHYVNMDKFCYDGIAEAMTDIGIRGMVVRSTVNQLPAPEFAHEKIETAQKEAARIIEAYHGSAGGRIKVRVEPLNEGVVSGDMIKAMHDVTRNYNVGFSMHVAEVKSRVEEMKQKHGLSTVAFLNSLGVLGPESLLAHCIWLDEKDIDILAETNTQVVHNPVSNQYLSDGIAPVPALLKRGVNVVLGADGAASNNSQDMFEVMKSAVLLQKVSTLNPLSLTAEKALEMATVDAAKALGMEKEIGSLEPGKKADIILIDLLTPEMTPSVSIVSNLVYTAKGSTVDTVIVDGKIVVKDKVLVTLDEKGIIYKANAATRRMINATGDKSLFHPCSWPLVKE